MPCLAAVRGLLWMGPKAQGRSAHSSKQGPVVSEPTEAVCPFSQRPPNDSPKRRLSFRDRRATHRYPGAVESVRVVRDSHALPGLLNKAFNLAKEIKALEEQQQALDLETDDSGGGDDGDGGGGGGGEMGTKEARAADLRANLETRLSDAIAEHEKAAAAAEAELAEIDVPDNDRGVFSFVCFRTRSVAHFAQQVMTSVAVHKAWPAPADADVNWSTLYPEAARKTMAARATVTASYYGMLCFYSVPIAFVSTLIELETLQVRSGPVPTKASCRLANPLLLLHDASLPQSPL